MGSRGQRSILTSTPGICREALQITLLKAEDGEPMRVGGAALAGAAMRAGLIDEYEIVTHPVLVAARTPFFTALIR